MKTVDRSRPGRAASKPAARRSASSRIDARLLKRAAPLLILLAAFGLQLAYLTELRAMFPARLGVEPFCGVDAQAHWERSSGFLNGTIPGDRVLYFVPLYPLYLAVLNLVSGPSLWLPIFIQALLQIVGLAALYGLGKLIFSPLAGLLAALGLATYSYYLFYLPCFDQALLTTPFLLLALFLLVKSHPDHHPGYIAGAGVALALALLSRPTVLTLGPVIVIWLFWFRPSTGRFWRNMAALGLPILLAVAPFTWRNYQVSGQFVLLSNNFGINLFTGNNPDAQGFDSLAHVQTQPAVPRFLETIRRVHAGETSFAAEAVNYMQDQPLDALQLTLRKTWLWFGETELPLVEPFFPLAATQAKTLTTLPVSWQAAALVALLGILLARGRSWAGLSLIWGVYAVFSLFTILFFIQLRFRLPFTPFVMLSAAALLALAPVWSRKNRARFGGVLSLLLLLTPFVSGLSLFALLFAGLGLWSFLWRGRGQAPYRWLAAAIAVYLLLVSVWGRAEALASDVSQPIDIYLGPPLAATSVLGQTFQMDCDGLHRIDITLGLFADRHDQPVTFYLAADPSADQILFSETFEGAAIRDYQTKSFYFEPIADSKGRTFFFYITSPGSTPDNALTARGYSDTPVDHYPQGSGFAGQPGALQQLQADFAFGAYCRLTPWQKINQAFSQFLAGSEEGS